MNCKDVKEYFDEFTLGILDGNAMSLIRDHIGGCKDCNSYFQDNKKLSVLMECWDVIEAKPDFVSDFWKKIDDKKHKEKAGILEFIRGFGKTALIPSVVALLLCSVLIINMYQSVTHQPTFTEKDIKDEEFLNEIENIVTNDNYEMLNVYGVWNDLDKEGMEG